MPSYGGEIFYELTAQVRAEDAYYRISQVDFDGSESKGNVIFVPGQSLGERLSVYPKPAREQVWVQGISAGTTGRLLPVTGQTVRPFAQVTEGGMLDVSGLKGGVYTLQLLGEDKNAERTRIVIRQLKLKHCLDLYPVWPEWIYLCCCLPQLLKEVRYG